MLGEIDPRDSDQIRVNSIPWKKEKIMPVPQKDHLGLMTLIDTYLG